MYAEIQAIFDIADIEVNGNRDWDIQVHDERLWKRMILYGNIGLGDAYVEGWWDCKHIDQFICRILEVATMRQRLPWRLKFASSLLNRLLNLQSLKRAFQVGERHYDIGNDLYAAMLGPGMVYSCAYWQGGAASLEQAQIDKLELVCRKIGLRPGMRVLDVGCGWGSFAKYAAENYDVEVVGLTVSKEQVRFAEENLSGYPIEIRLQDYRTYDGIFDAVVSIGMFEHVGLKNYNQFMSVVEHSLREKGLFLLHTIGANQTRLYPRSWITKHIFPNGYIPSMHQIASVVENRFVVEDLHNFGRDYDRTLMAWHANFENAWPELSMSNSKYDQRFYRIWRYYLLSCAGAFRARDVQVWQWVLSPTGLPQGFERPAIAH